MQLFVFTKWSSTVWQTKLTSANIDIMYFQHTLKKMEGLCPVMSSMMLTIRSQPETKMFWCCFQALWPVKSDYDYAVFEVHSSGYLYSIYKYIYINICIVVYFLTKAPGQSQRLW